MACRLKEDVVSRNDEVEDLLVFGYSCKLFRDDEKALYIDQGKHLIPWMGDDTLKIDRYDARGTLYDLTQVEAPSGGFDRFFGLTDMERQVETMCDEERYRALVSNEEEESLYQEEELKRLHLALGDKGKEYGQVEYKYEGNSDSVEHGVEEITEKAVDKNEDKGEDEPFVPSPNLDLPVDMVLPETVKHNAIIERTALFINSQGPQMEILLKMKQSGNPLFNFLSFDNPLYNYYRHILSAIKGGRYKPEVEKSSDKRDQENEDDEHYLHPSLASSVSKVELAPSIPSINYKPSAHCAYSMLVNKIKDKKAKTSVFPSHLTQLKQVLERCKDEKREGNISGNESDSNCSTESRSSVKSKSSNHSVISNSTIRTNRGAVNQPFEVPPSDVQVIIDKMASYVAKNGRDFETVVQMKKDPRFEFLNSSHIYNFYYQYKLNQYENLEKSVKPEERNKLLETNIKAKDEQSKAKLTPVCFSIKKPKESEAVIERSALPVEESSDEEDKSDEKKESIGTDEKEKESKDDMIITVDLAAVEDKEEKNKKILAAERIKDKLTAAVREKVAIASKEKQLQLDRKRRAAAFLKNLQTEPGGLKVPILKGSHVHSREGAEEVTEDDSDVTSLPDVIDEYVDETKSLGKKDHQVKCEKYKNEKGNKILMSIGGQEHKEKCRDRLEKKEKISVDHAKSKEIRRTTDSSPSSDENDKIKTCLEGSRKATKRKSIDSSYSKNKMVKLSTSHSEEKRHKRRKHKKDYGRDRYTRKHCKSKKQKRNKGSDDERRKRSRRDSASSSDHVS